MSTELVRAAPRRRPPAPAPESQAIASRLLVPLVLLAAACAPPPPSEEAAEAPAAVDEVAEIPAGSESEPARALFAEGEYLLDVGRGVEAREKFRAALAEDPTFVRAHVGQSNAALSFPEFQQSLDRAGEHLDGASEGEGLLVEINRTFLTNDGARGVELGERLVEAYPTSARAAIVLAGMQANQNLNEAARASYGRALELDDDHPGALYGIANNYLFGEPKDFARAEEYTRRLIEEYPAEAKGFEVLGDIMRAQNDLEAALAAYNEASEVDPTLEVAHHKRGHVNSFLGRIDDARAAYDAAVAAAPPESKAGYAVYKTFTRIHQKNVPAALTELEKLADGVAAMGTPAEQVKGLQVFAWNSHATAALHAGLLDRAARAIERRNALVMAIAEEVGTDDARRLQTADCHLWDGLLAAHRGDGAGAAAHAEKIRELTAGDDNPRKLEPAHYVLGMAALVAGDPAGAAEHLRQADHANNMYIRYQLALAEAGAGNAEEARRLFDQVARYNFNSVGFALVGRDAARRATG